MADDREALTQALAASIRLGYDVEKHDPCLGFDMPPNRELEWLAAWLVSEGWVRRTE